MNRNALTRANHDGNAMNALKRKGPGRVVLSYARALTILISSRIVVGLAMFFAATYVPQKDADALWNVNSSWYRFLLRWDSGWYLRIVGQGYSYNGNNLEMQPVVFYPLYPLLSKAVTEFLGINAAVATLLVSNLSLLAAALFLFKLIKDDYGEETAFLALASLSFFPTAIFFSTGYTESLALLIIVGFFLLLKKKWFFLAASCAGFACATRSTGLVLLLPLVWEIWRTYVNEKKLLVLNAAACSIIATSGLWLYMLYLWVTFNSPFALLSGTRAWQQANTASGNLGLIGSGALFQALTLQPFWHLQEIFSAGPNPNTLDPWFFLLFLLLIVIFRKRVPVAFTLYALGVLLLPYITVSGSLGFQSFGRYILLAFPVFIVIGQSCQKRVWLGLNLVGLEAALLFMYSVMFAQWYWIG